MSLILDGTNGLSDIDGTAATPAIRGTDANTGIFFPAADTIAFSEGGVEAARFDASGNLGIGTSSPTGKLNVVTDNTHNGGSTFDSTGTTQAWFRDTDAGSNLKNWGIQSSGGDFNILKANDDRSTGFVTPFYITTTGVLAFNSGYGSAAPAYGCRAWVNFDGTTNTGGFCTIRASGNVTSITDNGTGDYTVNFTTAMPDANYSVAASSSIAADGTFTVPVTQTKSVGGNAIVAPTTSAVRLTTQGNGGSAGARDAEYVNVSIHR
jgi:hypothetical protein